jgi:hypothetical protein
MRQEIKLGSCRKIAAITLYRKAMVGPAEKNGGDDRIWRVDGGVKGGARHDFA